MSNPSFVKNYTAGGAINAYRIVKFSAAETVVLGAAATDNLIGVCSDVSPAANERCDVYLEGMVYIEAGAAVAQGAPVTADAVGRGVTAAPAAGANNRIVGFAIEAASAAGDLFRVLLSPGYMQG
ncbi:DUF2190 family protein [Chitinimonas sp.]|uniref:DUF2190 family protein n=1 Tax=Chitinimonas sp. TaxID=1934313 RepID=UPI0035B054D7